MARVQGADRIARRFARLPSQMRARVRPALHQGADELVAWQKRLAPDDPTTPPPDLRSSIRKKMGEHDLAVVVFTDDFKARWLEFGTVKMAARPFFFPPYRALRRRIRGRISRAVKKAVHG